MISFLQNKERIKFVQKFENFADNKRKKIVPLEKRKRGS